MKKEEKIAITLMLGSVTITLATIPIALKMCLMKKEKRKKMMIDRVVVVATMRQPMKMEGIFLKSRGGDL